jgi:hypothetical protein
MKRLGSDILFLVTTRDLCYTRAATLQSSAVLFPWLCYLPCFILGSRQSHVPCPRLFRALVLKVGLRFPLAVVKDNGLLVCYAMG